MGSRGWSCNASYVETPCTSFKGDWSKARIDGWWMMLSAVRVLWGWLGKEIEPHIKELAAQLGMGIQLGCLCPTDSPRHHQASAQQVYSLWINGGIIPSWPLVSSGRKQLTEKWWRISSSMPEYIMDIYPGYIPIFCASVSLTESPPINMLHLPCASMTAEAGTDLRYSVGEDLFFAARFWPSFDGQR